MYSEIKVVIIAAIAKCVWLDFLFGVSNEKAGQGEKNLPAGEDGEENGWLG